MNGVTQKSHAPDKLRVCGEIRFSWLDQTALSKIIPKKDIFPDELKCSNSQF